MLPTTIPELVAQLEEQYPPKCIEPGQTLEEAYRYAGMVQLIQNLRDRLSTTERKQLANKQRIG